MNKDKIVVGVILIVLIGFLLFASWSNINPGLIHNR